MCDSSNRARRLQRLISRRRSHQHESQSDGLELGENSPMLVETSEAHVVANLTLSCPHGLDNGVLVRGFDGCPEPTRWSFPMQCKQDGQNHTRFPCPGPSAPHRFAITPMPPYTGAFEMPRGCQASAGIPASEGENSTCLFLRIIGKTWKSTR